MAIGNDFSFSRAVDAVPLMAAEFPSAATEDAIVFAGNESVVMPALILGLRANENLYLTAEGKWDVKYVPAFLRRYPFVFSSVDQGKTFTLCIDESYPGFNREDRGGRQFGEDGKPSAYTENVLKFLKEHQAQFASTDELELIYLHLQSMRNFNLMRDRVVASIGENQAAQ